MITQLYYVLAIFIPRYFNTWRRNCPKPSGYSVKHLVHVLWTCFRLNINLCSQQKNKLFIYWLICFIVLRFRLSHAYFFGKNIHLHPTTLWKGVGGSKDYVPFLDAVPLEKFQKLIYEEIVNSLKPSPRSISWILLSIGASKNVKEVGITRIPKVSSDFLVS